MPDIEEKPGVPPLGVPNQESAGWGAVGGASASGGVTLTSGAANTKGNWAQIIASTSKKCVGLGVSVITLTGAYRYLIDIGTGASGSEVVKVPNLFARFITGAGTRGYFIFVSFRIPAGTRIAARCQSSGASQTLEIAVGLMEAD